MIKLPKLQPFPDAYRWEGGVFDIPKGIIIEHSNNAKKNAVSKL